MEMNNDQQDFKKKIISEYARKFSFISFPLSLNHRMKEEKSEIKTSAVKQI